MSDPRFFHAWPEYRATVDVYAPASLAGGTAGTPTLLHASALVLLVPNSDLGRWGAAPEGLAGARSDFLAMDYNGTVAIRAGCEVRTAAGTYVCDGTANWGIGRVAGLSLPH